MIELDEKDREEMFRLKRFKQLKYKKKKEDYHICCCCLKMFESEENVRESVCPVCQKAVKAIGKQSEMRLNVVPCKSAEIKGKENKKRLEHLMSHIDEVINLSQQYKTDGIVTPSIDKFIRTCSQVKEKIEDYSTAPPLCDMCKKGFENTGSRITLVSKIPRTGSSKSVFVPPCTPDRPTEEPFGSDSTYNITPETEEKLGYFEKKFKEIVKVTRLQNEDGSVSEEKQVITIKTERRNPRHPNTFDGENVNSEKCLGSNNPSNGYGGGFSGRGSSSGCRPKGGYRGDGGGSNYRKNCPREIKSEHTNRNHQMGEPRLRSCISANPLNATMNRDAFTTFDASACVSTKPSKVTLPPEPEHISPCSAMPKISKASSIDSNICCPRKTASVCGSELQSGVSSMVSIESAKPISKTASVQTCCKEVRVKKPMVDQGTCCLPVCDGEAKCTENKDVKSKTASTNALWRDVWTSTSDLPVVPSKMSCKKSSPTSVNRKDHIVCERNYSSESIQTKRSANNAGSCCIIKNTTKQPKVCCFDENDKKDKEKKVGEEVVLRGSMLDAIKKIFLPPNRSTDSVKMEAKKESDIKNICTSCLSKLSNAVPSQKSTNITFSESHTGTMCQAKPEELLEREINSCSSGGSLSRYSSCASMSNKSMAVGSSSSLKHTCSKSSSKSAHEKKHTCCLSKKSSEVSSDENTCCAMAQTKSSKTVCCSKKKSGAVCCPAKGSKEVAESSCAADTPKASATSLKSSGSCCQKQDAATCTRRSARYDVRPLRRKNNCGKITLTGDCTCYSDSYMLQNKGQNRKLAPKSKSFCEDDYYYFRW